MKFYLIIIMILFLFIAGCSTDTKYPENYVRYKTLEYTRIGNISEWQKVFEESDISTKKDILYSIAKTKNDSLFTYLKQLLLNNPETDLINPLVFALGQLKIIDAEKLLIRYFESNPPVTIQNNILSAFEQCGSDLCLETLRKSVLNDSLRKCALQTAAILARKKVDVSNIKAIVGDSTWSFNNLKENAYFIYNSCEISDLPVILSNIPETEGLTQKYYLRAFLKLASTNADSVFIKNDSTFKQTLDAAARKVLTENVSWQNNFYALQCLNYTADSTDENLALKFTGSANPHLKIEALKLYSKIFKENSSGFLINQFNMEENFAVKGKILFYIAEYNPDAAYRLIMQNLDRGTVAYKQDLLSALAQLDDKLAINSIHGYLFVNEKRLVNHAFDILNKKNEISFTDIEKLMNTEHYSVLYNILDWQIQHKQYVDTGLLFKAFSRFKTAENFETQDLITDILIIKKTNIPLTNITELLSNAANNSIYEKLTNAFPGSAGEAPKWNNTNPDYLAVDSLLTLPKENIIVEIATNKGEIEIELLPTIAPLTVKNFLSLAEKKFYNDLSFHRVIADFVIQGGDPTGDGWGGAGYTVPSEDMLPFERGSVGIATSGFDTGSCQFFICQSEQPHLRGNYTVFGQVIKGMDVVDTIMMDDVILSVIRIQ